MNFTVYLIINLLDWKVYVGYTKSLAFRWKCHCSPAPAEENRHLSRTIRKFGVENFRLETLALTDSAEKAKEIERLWIVTLRSYNPEVGYNLTLGGEGLAHPSDQTRKKMSDSHKGKPQPISVVQKRAAANKIAWVKRKEKGDHLLLAEQARRNAAAMKGKTWEENFGVEKARGMRNKRFSTLIPVEREDIKKLTVPAMAGERG